MVAVSGAFKKERDTSLRLTLEGDTVYFVVPSTFAAGKEGTFYFSMISAEQVTLLECRNSEKAESAKDIKELDNCPIEDLPEWSGESDEHRKSEKDDFEVKQADATVLKAEQAWAGAIQWGERDHDKYYEERRFCEEVEKRREQLKDSGATEEKIQSMMFEDPDFPAVPKSMYHDASEPYGGNHPSCFSALR